MIEGGYLLESCYGKINGITVVAGRASISNGHSNALIQNMRWMIGLEDISKYLSILGISQGDLFAAEGGLGREVSVPVTVYRERPRLMPNAVRKKREKTNQ